MADRTVTVSLIARVTGFKSSMMEGARSVREFGKELDSAKKKSKVNTNEISAGLAGAGLALSALAGWAIKSTLEFDRAMSEVKSVTNATSTEFDALRDAAIKAGKDVKYSAQQAAQAEAELGKAGLTTAQIVGGGLTGALSLAAAGSLDLAEAADVSAKTLATFGLGASSTQHVADMLAGTANATATDVHELSMALRQGGLAANAAGLSLDDTLVTLGAFASHALVGSDAGTSLKTMLTFLAAPTEKASDLMRELGLELYDAEGNFVGVYELAGQLKSQLGGLTQQQRQSALATIFGQDAMRAALVMYDLGREGMLEYTDSIMANADAQKTASTKTDNLAGDIERLKSKLESLAIESGSGATGGIRLLVQALDSMVGTFSDLPDFVQTSIVVLAGMSGTALLLAAGFLKSRQTISDTMDALRDMGPRGEAAAKGISAVGRALGRIALVSGGLFAVYEVLSLLYRTLAEESRKPIASLDEMTKSLESFAATGRLTGAIADVFGRRLQKLNLLAKAFELDSAPLREFDAAAADAAASANTTAEELGKLSEKTAEQHAKAELFKKGVSEMDAALADMVRNGGARQALIFFEQFKDKWVSTGRSVADLNALFPEYVKATGEAAVATTGAAAGFADASTRAQVLNSTLQESIETGLSLVDVFELLNGAAIGLGESQIKAESAVDRLASALDDSSGSLDINTEEGRAAKQAAYDLAEAAAEVAQAKYEESGSVEAASETYDEYISRLRSVLRQAGVAESKVDALVDSISAMPKSRETKIKIIAESSGLQNALNMVRAINALASNPLLRLLKSAPGRAAGGWMNPGQIYQVGERGPEYVMPQRQMYVAPNSAGRPGTVRVELAPITIRGTGLLTGLREVVQSQGGNVQTVLGGTR